MTKLLKASLLTMGIVSVMGLTACQSTPQQSQAKQHTPNGERHFKGPHGQWHGADRHHKGPRAHDRRAPLTAEQRAELDKKRSERLAQYQAKRDAIAKACEGKVGQTIAIKVGEKTVNGTCQVNFKPERLTPQKVENSTTPANS